LKEEFSNFNPKIMQIDPYWTNHCATGAIGAEIDDLLNIPELTFSKRSARSQGFDRCDFFGRENIDVWNPFKSDSNRTTGGAHCTMGAGIQLHQLNHG
jgi:hypothetical protein